MIRKAAQHGFIVRTHPNKLYQTARFICIDTASLEGLFAADHVAPDYAKPLAATGTAASAVLDQFDSTPTRSNQGQ